MKAVAGCGNSPMRRHQSMNQSTSLTKTPVALELIKVLHSSYIIVNIDLL